MENNTATEKLIQLLEQQLEQAHEQNQELSRKLDQALEQIRQLTKALYGSKSEKSKYQAPDGQVSLFEDDPSFNEPEQTEEQSTETIRYSVTLKKNNKKRNDSFCEEIEIEAIHHHPANITCDVFCNEKIHSIATAITQRCNLTWNLYEHEFKAMTPAISRAGFATDRLSYSFFHVKQQRQAMLQYSALSFCKTHVTVAKEKW